MKWPLLIGVGGVGLILFIAFTIITYNSRPQNTSPNSPTNSPKISPKIPSSELQHFENRDGQFDILLPKSWKLKDETPQGILITSVTAESPDFKVRVDNTSEGPFSPIYYEQGGQINITAQTGNLEQDVTPAGEILEQKKISISGQDATFYKFKEPSTAQGVLLAIWLDRNDKSYFLRFGYNPDTYPQGEQDFQTIYNSFKFKDFK